MLFVGVAVVVAIVGGYYIGRRSMPNVQQTSIHGTPPAAENRGASKAGNKGVESGTGAKDGAPGTGGMGAESGGVKHGASNTGGKGAESGAGAKDGGSKAGLTGGEIADDGKSSTANTGKGTEKHLSARLVIRTKELPNGILERNYQAAVLQADGGSNDAKASSVTNGVPPINLGSPAARPPVSPDHGYDQFNRRGNGPWCRCRPSGRIRGRRHWCRPRLARL